MAMQSQVSSISMGRGMDSKSDPKISARPILLKDGIFTAPGQIAKRNGNDSATGNIVGGGTWSSPIMTKSYRNELTLAAQNSAGDQRLFSWSPTLSGWRDRGKYWSVGVGKQIVNTSAFSATSTNLGPPYGTANSSCVVAGNIALYAFDTAGPDYGFNSANSGSNATYITVVDQQTGTHLADSVQITNALGFSKAVLLGSSTFAVFYITSSLSNTLAFRIITVTLAGGVSIGAEVQVGTCAALSSLSAQFPYCYDVQTTSSGCVVAVADEPDLILWPVSSSGSVGTQGVIVSSGNITPVSILADSGGNFWVYWVSAGTSLQVAVYSSSLAQVVAPTTAATLSAGAYQIAAINVSANEQAFYYSTQKTPASTVGVIYPTLWAGTATRTGSSISIGTPAVLIQNVDIYGKPFTSSSRNFMPVVSYSGTGATGFLIDLADALPVAKFLQLEAEGIYSVGFDEGGAVDGAPTILGFRYPGFLNSVQALSATQFLLGCGFVSGTNPITPSSSTNLSAFPETVTDIAFLGVSSITFDFGNIDAYQGLIQQDTLAMNGGVMEMYDGAAVVELGFSIDPDNVSVTARSSGGSMAAGTYIYFVTYEWTDANGNFYISAPSIGVTAFFGSGSSNSVYVQWPTLNLTQKQNVVVKVWRQDSNIGGSLAYLVGIFENVPQGAGLAYNFMVDAEASASIAGNETLYTQGDAVLENIAPPPAMIMWLNNMRLHVVDSENPETTIEYCKTASSGTGISFSTGQLEVLVDSFGGAITGGIRMDEKTVIGKQTAIGYFTGDGANDAGTGESFTPFQFIPSDVGVTNSKSMASFPRGTIFKSDKGIYLLSRGLEVSYFGSDVEAYNGQDVQSVQLLDSKNQLRFLTSNGSSLVYDYVLNLWGTLSNFCGISADVWNGKYVYVRSQNNAQDNGALFIENTTTFLDNATPYALTVQLQWLKAMAPQGFQRLRKTILLGDYKNGSNAGHGVQMQAAYDFQPNFSTAIGYTFGAASSSGVFQYREDLPQQICDSIQLLITEVVTGASGEYIDLTDLGIDIGSYRGLNRLPALQSV